MDQALVDHQNSDECEKLHLTLDNFDNDDFVPDNCPYVLTSPRSLEACKIVGVKVSL